MNVQSVQVTKIRKEGFPDKEVPGEERPGLLERCLKSLSGVKFGVRPVRWFCGQQEGEAGEVDGPDALV